VVVAAVDVVAVVDVAAAVDVAARTSTNVPAARSPRFGRWCGGWRAATSGG
jgi:hypothetical protein